MKGQIYIMKKKILILDDKETMVKVMSHYLSSDFDCVSFDNPIKGLEWLYEGNMPDLILLDIRMPEMRGDEFLHIIKDNDMLKTIPVIMVSAEDNSEERIRLLSEGAEDYITKPFNPMELKIRISKVLR